jgi:hypothetical protein
MASSEYLIEPLDPKKYDRESFICEEPALNEFIRKHANRESKANTSKYFVLTRSESPSTIRGYYTLSARSIALNSLPRSLAKNSFVPAPRKISTSPPNQIGTIEFPINKLNFLSVKDALATYLVRQSPNSHGA